MATQAAVDSMKATDNLINLEELSEATILDNIIERYKKGIIYTYVGNILVSVNPYQPIDIYGTPFLEKYTRRGITDDLPPHVFALADESYNNARNSALLRETAGNQAIIVSGESGAGKTECSKVILRYLTHLNGDVNSTIANRILNANPILEAFGNAKTVRNDNSSRFGKFVMVRYDALGQIVGSSMDIFLLEKSRIVRLAAGERNYHIFYALLNAPQALKDKYRLTKASNYYYLNQSGVVESPGDKVYANYELIVKAFDSLGVKPETRESIMMTVAAILHLGNVTFTQRVVSEEASRDPELRSSEAAAEIDNPQEVENAAALLEIPADELKRVLLFRDIRMRQGTIRTPLSAERAANARDTVSKALYAYLFRFLVDTINRLTLVGETVRSYFIGVLDIFGFENFEINSFEQLCINHANERLQQFFQRTVFKVEQELYNAEGIWWAAIDFSDNFACIDLFEAKPSGIIHLLEDEGRLPNSTDMSLLQKMVKSHGADPTGTFSRKPQSESEFMINHFAGRITYDVRGFLEKNHDNLGQEIVMLFTTSAPSTSLVNGLFLRDQEEISLSARSYSRRHATLSVFSKFRESLQSLMETLQSSSPLFIRCLKPNAGKLPNNINEGMLLEQLRYTGMLETVRIRRAGYPRRLTIEAVLERYQQLVRERRPDHDQLSINDRTIVLLDKLMPGGYPNLWQVGKTKVFLTDAAFAKLETHVQNETARIVLKLLRGNVERQKYLRARASIRQMQAACRALLAVKALQNRKALAGTLQTAARNRLAYLRVRNLKTAKEKQEANTAVTLQWAVRTRFAQRQLATLRVAAAERLRAAALRRAVEEKRSRRLEQQDRSNKTLALPFDVLSGPNPKTASSGAAMATFSSARTRTISDPMSFTPIALVMQFASPMYQNKYHGRLSAVKQQLGATLTKNDGDFESEIRQVLPLILLVCDPDPSAPSIDVILRQLIPLCQHNSACAQEAFFAFLAQLTDASFAKSARVWAALTWLATCVLTPRHLLPFVLAALARVDTPPTNAFSEIVFHRLGWNAAMRGGRRFPPMPAESDALLRVFAAHLALASPPATIADPAIPLLHIINPAGTVAVVPVPLNARAAPTADALMAAWGVPAWLKSEFALCIETPTADVWMDRDEYVWDAVSAHNLLLAYQASSSGADGTVVAPESAASPPLSPVGPGVPSLATGLPQEAFAVALRRRTFGVNELEPPAGQPPLSDAVIQMLVGQQRQLYLAGRFVCTKEEAVRAAALLVVCGLDATRGIPVHKIQKDAPSSAPLDELSGPLFNALVRASIPKDVFDSAPADEWMANVAAALKKERPSPEVARRQFLALVHKMPFYGAGFCPTQVGIRKAVIVVSPKGLEVVGASSKQAVYSIDFKDIVSRQMGDDGRLVLSLNENKSVCFKTDRTATRAVLQMLDIYAPQKQ